MQNIIGFACKLGIPWQYCIRRSISNKYTFFMELQNFSSGFSNRIRAACKRVSGCYRSYCQSFFKCGIRELLSTPIMLAIWYRCDKIEQSFKILFTFRGFYTHEGLSNHTTFRGDLMGAMAPSNIPSFKRGERNVTQGPVVLKKKA